MKTTTKAKKTKKTAPKKSAQDKMLEALMKMAELKYKYPA